MTGFYFCSTLMWDADVQQMVDMAISHGFEGIELWAQHVEAKSLDLERLKKLKKETGLSLIVHAKSWDLNYAALNHAVRKASLGEIKASIDLAEYIGASEVTVHPPRYTLKENEEARDRAYDSICRFTDYADRKKISISMEIMEHIPKEMATTPKGMRAIVRDLENRLTCTVDLAHCQSEEEFVQNIKDMKRVSKLHISNKKKNRLHVPIPDGDLDFKRIYPGLQKLRIPMVLEGYEEGKDFETLIKNISYIKSLKENSYEKENSTFRNSNDTGIGRLQFQWH